MDAGDSGLVGLADDQALDFLNSTATPVRDVVDLIEDGRSYVAWLEHAGLVSGADVAAVSGLFAADELDAVAAQAVALREWLRTVVAAWAGPGDGTDEPIPSAVRSRLNDVLRHDHAFVQVPSGHGGRDVVRARHWHDPQQLLVPVAEAAARLLIAGDPALVRRCEGPTCTLWFYDRTKSHRRRWCSMAVCGNRAKARNHRERNR